jgi:hypothetical protein
MFKNTANIYLEDVRLIQRIELYSSHYHILVSAKYKEH